MKINEEKALQIIRKYLIQQEQSRKLEIQDGLPEGCILYGVPEDEPCWTVWIPSDTPRIGCGRIICISKETGKILYDGNVGE